MKVNIICSDPTWIYGQFIEQFKKHSKNTILLNVKNDYDIIHFLPYYEQYKVKCPATAWFSHQELKSPLKDKFISAGKEVDFCFSHARQYASVLRNSGIDERKIEQIMPGVDLEKFRQRKAMQDRKKLVIGYVGRQYTSSNRKNPELLKKIAKLPFVELRATDGKVPAEKMPEFYAGLDLTISPATIEGGPMSILESLAVGVPILCYEGVGVADEFRIGCFRIPLGNEERLFEQLEDFWAAGVYKHFGRQELMNKMLDQVKEFTWERFVERHDKIWERIYENRPNR